MPPIRRNRHGLHIPPNPANPLSRLFSQPLSDFDEETLDSATGYPRSFFDFETSSDDEPVAEPDPWNASVPPTLPDSPRNELPATLAEIQAFRAAYPAITRRRYIHYPDRRRQAQLPDRAIRRCQRCNSRILPYEPTKCCPSCLRGRQTIEYPGFCRCPCLCPPESDDEMDEDYKPEESDEEDMDVEDPNDRSVFPQQRVLASTVGYNQHHVITERSLLTQDPNSYTTAVEAQPPDSELSSTFNQANTVTQQEAGRLCRPAFRNELSQLLDTGWTRRELRRQFYETRIYPSSSYLPNDVVVRRRPDFPAVCWRCRRYYSSALRDALTVGERRNHMFMLVDDAIDTMQESREWDLRNELLQDYHRRVVYIYMCNACGLPRRGLFELVDFQGDCLCYCRCPLHVFGEGLHELHETIEGDQFYGWPGVAVADYLGWRIPHELQPSPPAQSMHFEFPPLNPPPPPAPRTRLQPRIRRRSASPRRSPPSYSRRRYDF